jgi:hypothetical protein
MLNIFRNTDNSRHMFDFAPFFRSEGPFFKGLQRFFDGRMWLLDLEMRRINDDFLHFNDDLLHSNGRMKRLDGRKSEFNDELRWFDHELRHLKIDLGISRDAFLEKKVEMPQFIGMPEQSSDDPRQFDRGKEERMTVFSRRRRAFGGGGAPAGEFFEKGGALAWPP